MKFSPPFMKMCKPMYRLGMVGLRIGMGLSIIGLLVGILGKGWLLIFIGIVCLLLGTILGNIPTQYLVSFIKTYDENVTAKQATDIAQNHLRQPTKSNDDTMSFVRDVMDGFEREKRRGNKG